MCIRDSPKGVRHTDQTLLAAGIGLAKALGVDDNDVGSMVFPYAHIGGPDYLIMMLSAGMPAAVMASFTLEGAIESTTTGAAPWPADPRSSTPCFLASSARTPTLR